MLTFGSTLAISWLPVTESARSTIIARRALSSHSLEKESSRIGRPRTHLFAGSHIRLMILSSVSLPPSFKALVMDLMPCSLVAYSSKPLRMCSRAISR